MAIAFLIILIHYLADFICQDEKWAVGKSKNNRDLLSHTLTYSLIWIIPVGFMFYWVRPNEIVNWYILHALIFACVTLIAHTITDNFTSRLVSKLFADKRYGSSIPNFGAFSAIGFDQVLHYGQLFLTFYLLSK